MRARSCLLACAVALSLPAVAAPSEPPQAATASKPSIAVVNGHPVSAEEFERALAGAVRQKFYHRAPPEGQLDEVRREVAESLVDRALVLAEAEKRGIPVDQNAIQQTLDGYEQRYGKSPNWNVTREQALPLIRAELTSKQLAAGLEAKVRDVPQPADAAVRAYYDANPSLFTEPERVHVSTILLKVDPSASKAVRDKAREEGRQLHERLVKGADFAELAKIHSADASAPRGGDLGYLHRGMLADTLHQQLDALKPGEFTPSFDVLEGVAILKLHARTAPKLREFADVRERAGELLKRERADKAWKDFVADLRGKAKIEKHPTLFPASGAPKGGDATKEPTWAATTPERSR